MKATQETEKLPILVHFGCGQLGVGAVLPFLIHQYGDSHRIVVVQRRSTDWKDVPHDIILPLTTSIGDYMPFRTVVLERADKLCAKLADERRILILPSDMMQGHHILASLAESSQGRLIVSCSLAGGQTMLVQLLRSFSDWEKALVFENTPSREWNTLEKIATKPREDQDKLGGTKPKKWHHILADRICWALEPFSLAHNRPYVLCHCERAEVVRFFWPKASGLVVAPQYDSSTVLGEQIHPDWTSEEFSDDSEERDWQHLRKRALINAPHTVAALLCYRLIAERGMEPEGQYLAPLHEMLRFDHPEWESAFDTYLRLRAAEVSHKRPASIRTGDEREAFHADFADAYFTARHARRRYFSTSDRLDRLMSPDNLAKELQKFDEHILQPVTFYETNRDLLAKLWVYDRPDQVDLTLLRGFLTETFLAATRLVSSRPKPVSVHTHQK